MPIKKMPETGGKCVENIIDDIITKSETTKTRENVSKAQKSDDKNASGDINDNQSKPKQSSPIDRTKNLFDENGKPKNGFDKRPQDIAPNGGVEEKNVRRRLQNMIENGELDKKAWKKFEKDFDAGKVPATEVLSVIKDWCDQLYGKPKQTTDLTTGGEKITSVEVRFTDGK
jgi:hypothetical protein